MVFSPAGYLRGLGWNGPGSSLQPNNVHARAKPITIPQKKTLSGVGKDRDTAYPWWEMVFATVATKVSGDKGDHHRTSTGIISPRPPPKVGEIPPPPPPASNGFNMSALDAAKMESARRQLYSGFHKGEAMGASLQEETVVVVVRTKEEIVESEEDTEMAETAVVEIRSTKKVKKSKQTNGQEVDEVVAEIKLSKDQRRAAKVLRKAGRASTIASTSTLVTPAESESDVAAPSLPKKSKSSKSSKKIVELAPASPRAVLTIEERATLEEEEYQSAMRAAKIARKEAKKEAKASRSGTETIEVESKKKRKRDK